MEYLIVVYLLGGGGEREREREREREWERERERERRKYTACLMFFQDIFWYVFLSNFQPNPASQQKLFNRTAHNYVKLIFYAKDPFFRDTFLKVCHCFTQQLHSLSVSGLQTHNASRGKTMTLLQVFSTTASLQSCIQLSPMAPRGHSVILTSLSYCQVSIFYHPSQGNSAKAH